MANKNAYKTQRIINSLLFEQTSWWMAERLAELMASLMLDQKHSDLTLKCDGEEFPVHKAVVLTQSVVLEKACHAHWKEGTDSVIHIKEFDAQTVRRMVEFLYTGDYDQGKPEFVTPAENDQASEAGESDTTGSDDGSDDVYQPPSKPDANEWGPADETAADDFIYTFSPQLCVHAIADYYMMNDLKQKAIEKVKTLLKKTVWSAKGFLAIAKEAFETTMSPSSTAADPEQQEGETLREIMVYIAFRHFTDITHTKDFARMDLDPEFAALLLQKASKNYNSVRAEMKHQEKDNFERWHINSIRTSQLIQQVIRLQAQNRELEDRIERIQEVTACRDSACYFNVSVREGRQEENSQKMYETVCTNCSGALSRELVEAGNDGLSHNSGYESQDDLAGDIFNDDGAAGEDEDDIFTGAFFDLLNVP